MTAQIAERASLYLQVTVEVEEAQGVPEIGEHPRKRLELPGLEGKRIVPGRD